MVLRLKVSDLFNLVSRVVTSAGQALNQSVFNVGKEVATKLIPRFPKR